MKSSVLSSAHRSPRRSQSLSRAPAGRSSRPLTAFANTYNQPRERSLLRSLVDDFLFPISPLLPRPKARSLIITGARLFGPTQNIYPATTSTMINLFRLPLARERGAQSSGSVIDYTPCDMPSYPACEPNFFHCSKSHSLRHIQNNRTASLRAMAILATA